MSRISHYTVLGIEPSANFAKIKKAYYKKAKELHPDLHGGSREKEEAFKKIVVAFELLSDPRKKIYYDSQQGFDKGGGQEDEGSFHRESFSDYHEENKYAIMDTYADDILEELMAGNNPPRNTTLATLFMDLQRTDVFITFREGKNHFFSGNYHAALPFFRNAVRKSPNNILYRCFLARTLGITGKYREAKFHYRAALNIGKRRNPEQHLRRVSLELEAVNSKRLPWWSAFMKFIFPKKDNSFIKMTDRQMLEDTNRTINQIMKKKKLRDKEKKSSDLNKEKEKKMLEE